MITQNRHQWYSLAGGELSEEMFGRVDLPRHSIGMKRCYNAVVSPQGAVQNRAGSKFVATTNGNAPAWLVPFVRSDGQGFLIEFGDAYIRVVGAGNVVNAAPDPGVTLTITDVDIWTPADGFPIVPVVFTTSGVHGLNVLDEIRFQNFTLVNPDQAGINQLAEFMNRSWIVSSVPSTTTFTIRDAETPISSAYNFGFELGNVGWNYSLSLSDVGNTPTIDNTSPAYAGTYSLKIISSAPVDPEFLVARTISRLPITAGEQAVLDCQVQHYAGGLNNSRLQMKIVFYNSAGAIISSQALALDATPVAASGGVNRITAVGLIGGAADMTWVPLSITATAPSGAASWLPQFEGSMSNTSSWAVDAINSDGYGDATWIEFSYAPYNGLVNPGISSLDFDVTPVALAPTYTQAHIRFASYAQFVDDLIIAHKGYPTARLTRIADNDWEYAALVFNATLAAPGTIAATANGTPGSPAITYNYTLTTLDDNGTESAIGTPDDADNTLRTLGNFNTITWLAVSDAYRYNIYKDIGGSSYGFIGSSVALTFTDDNIDADLTKQPPELLATFAAPGAYPGTVAFHEQRMILAGTDDEPQAFWASGLAGFEYFKASFPPQDDQAFSYTLSSLKAAPILHSLALNDLLFFTSGGVQRIVTTDTELFTPTTVATRPVVSYGAHELAKPQEAGTRVLYPVERGGHLYEMTPADNISGYDLEDLSIIAAHLIDTYDWVQTAFRRAPFPIWYGLRDDGIIIGLTYMPEQKVFAWHQHELPGAVVESIAVVPEGNRDVLYVVARRTIAGSEVRYIERVANRDFGTDQAEAFFVDSGITYRGVETDIVDGLDHLEGEEVMALADGRVLGPYTVTSGAILLDNLATTIHVGLAYVSQVETVPLSFADQQGFGMGIMKNVSQVWMRLKQTLGIKAGVSFDDLDLRDLPDDETEELGSIPALRSGVQGIDATPVWNEDTTICIQQTQPLPFTLTGMAIDYVDG